MILWLTGNTGAGKTTLAKRLVTGAKNTVHLDGDDLRGLWPAPVDMSEEGRRANNIAIAKLAVLLESQGFAVVVSVIAPLSSIRREVEMICGCKWIHVDYNKFVGDPDRPYEVPYDPVMRIIR